MANDFRLLAGQTFSSPSRRVVTNVGPDESVAYGLTSPFDSRVAETMDGIKDSSSPREWNEWSWSSSRHVDEQIGVADVHTLDPEIGLRVVSKLLAISIEWLLLSHAGEVDRLGLDGVDEGLETLVQRS